MRSEEVREKRFTAECAQFMQAMHDYKISSGRMFPTWSEVLEVLQTLGYQKPALPASTAAAAPARPKPKPAPPVFVSTRS